MMLRHNVGSDRPVGKSCTKIRKRGAPSSSGASSSLTKLRFKRAVLVGRRGGLKSSTGSQCSTRNMSETSRNRHSYGPAEGMHSSVSARKLVNALWQLNKSPLSTLKDRLQDKLFEVEMRRARIDRQSLAPRSSVSERTNQSRNGRKFSEADEKKSWSSDLKSSATAMEAAAYSHDIVLTCSGDKPIRLNDLHNSLVASKELVKVLAHIWGPGELHPSAHSLLSALHAELDLARVHVRQLIKDRRSENTEITGLKKQFLEEMEAWKQKQKEKVETTLHLIIDELENQKKSRKIAERLNKKLGTALAKMEASLQAANKELERERRSRERVEKICNELIRGIGEDKAEVEEMRRETVKVQEELMKEREMLQLADELREERVQMKLLEARFQFEEKNAAIDQLRNELEEFLATKRTEEPAKEANVLSDQRKTECASENGNASVCDNGGNDKGEQDDDGEIDSEGSDMHSIELNVDGNSKSYCWSYAATSKDDTSKLSSDLWDLNQKFLELDDELDGEWDDRCSNSMRNLDQDAERYQAIKNLREQMLAGSGFVVSQDGGDGEKILK